MESHVLVVLAHPDDESFGCGGTIAHFCAEGVPVTYVCATRGEQGRRMGRPPFATRESLPDLREQELRAACAALGIGDLRLLGIRDKTVEFVDQATLATRIGAVLAELSPSLVITFHPVHGGHPDHNAIGAATMRAVAALPPGRRPRVLCPLGPVLARQLMQGESIEMETQTVEISAVGERKRAAIAAHRSQSEGMTADFSQDPQRQEWLKRRFIEERFIVYPV